MASVGATTTMLVIAEDQPFGRFATAHAEHWRAEELRREGRPIRIEAEADLRLRHAA